MSVVTTLNFNGQTEAALRHYSEALDAETLFLMRFRDSPDPSHTKPGMEDLIFHATFRVQETVLMATDVGYQDADSTPESTGFALALQFQSVNVAKNVFDALAEQGRVVIPLAESSFTAWYGLVMDRFGVSWIVNVNADRG